MISSVLVRIAFVALGIAVAVYPPVAVRAETAWMTSREDAINTARRSGTPILLYVSTDWCSHCKRMSQETWSDPDVARYVDANYSALYLDGDSNSEIADRYQLDGYPALLIFTASGEYLSQRTGFIDREQMLIWLSLFADERMEPLSALSVR